MQRSIYFVRNQYRYYFDRQHSEVFFIAVLHVRLSKKTNAYDVPTRYFCVLLLYCSRSACYRPIKWQIFLYPPKILMYCDGMQVSRVKSLSFFQASDEIVSTYRIVVCENGANMIPPHTELNQTSYICYFEFERC